MAFSEKLLWSTFLVKLVKALLFKSEINAALLKVNDVI